VANAFGPSTAEGMLFGAFSGGAASGVVTSVLYGGNMFQNALTSGISNGVLASIQGAAMRFWEAARDATDEVASQSKQAPLRNDRGQKVTAGILDCSTCPNKGEKFYEMLKQNHPGWNRLFGLRYPVDSQAGYFINMISKVHDWMNSFSYRNGEYVYPGPILDRAFDLYSFTGMPIAAAYTAFTFSPVGIHRGLR
jgi:hypothetical protein